MMIIDNEFEIGEIVYFKTDKSQNPNMVTEIIVHIDARLKYKTIAGTYESIHNGFELSREKSVLVTL